MTIFVTSSEDETKTIAAQIAKSALAGDVFAIKAPMGAGKSAFSRGFIQSLCGHDTEVPSPTFTIVQIYEHPPAPIWHFDLYRFETPEDIFNIGWDDALDGTNICLIEWPEKAGEYLPTHTKLITIDITGETTRKISIDEE